MNCLIRIWYFLIVFLVACPNTVFPQNRLQASLPSPDHIVVLILENHGYPEIIGTANAPHINALAKDTFSALFTQSFAIEHPSQPNYLDLFAGCNQGVTDDAIPSGTPYTTDNLGRELLDAAKTFVTYSEDLPNVGYNGASSNSYARKHNPAVNWMGTGANQIPLTTNQPFSAFPLQFSTLPDVCFVIPNLNDDMHDGSINTGDNWMFANLNNYIEWAKTHNSLFILTFDEDDNTAGNQVATIFTGATVKSGKYSETINHYSILRTIEDIYGLPYACNASTSSPITDCWNVTASVTANPTETSEKVFSLYPNPSNGEFIVRIEPSKIGTLKNLQVFTVSGEKVFEKNIEKTAIQSIALEHMGQGSYIVRVSDGTIQWTEKMIVQ